MSPASPKLTLSLLHVWFGNVEFGGSFIFPIEEPYCEILAGRLKAQYMGVDVLELGFDVLHKYHAMRRAVCYEAISQP